MDWNRLTAGLIAGGLAALAETAVSTRGGRWLGNRLEPQGLLLAPAILLGLLVMDRGLRIGLVVGCALLAGGATLPHRRVSWSLTALGALAVAWATPTGARLWVSVMVAMILPGVVLAGRSWAGSRLAATLLAASCLGLFLTVPDTEEALVLLGAVAAYWFGSRVFTRGFAAPPAPATGASPLEWAGRALPTPGSLGAAGLAAALTVFVWAAATGGRGRDGSVIGAMGCLGLLLVDPLTRWARRVGGATVCDSSRRRWGRVGVLLVHLVVVAVSARLAGSFRSPVAAGLIVLPVWILAAAFVASQHRDRLG